MNVVEVFQVSKSFNSTRAVDNVSFSIGQGEIFGMVGPNGAGKTTTIRMLMDIIKPDSGEIRILGESLHEETKNRIGYLPEERGLYRKITVSESLTYLSALKGMETGEAKNRANELLQHLNMLQHKDKKVEGLSRGMGQLIQFVVTILHDPELIVLDEPFSGMDPVNKELIKGMIIDLRNQGKTIILSTHLMNDIEELCDRILMINKGHAVLYGSLSEVKSKYRNNSIFLECNRLPKEIPGVIGSKDHGKYMELFLDGNTTPQEVLNILVNNNVIVERFEVSTPSLNEIFIQVVKEQR
ncbi:ABC transporter ATP-binding protein [Chloroflexota bacterium]